MNERNNEAIKITFLGTGGAEPVPGMGNVTLLLHGTIEPFLIDCSGNPAQAILQAGVELEKMGRVLLTHNHIDHTFALPSLVHSFWLHKGVKAGKSIQVYGPAEAIKIATGLISLYGLTEKSGAVSIAFHEVQHDKFDKIDSGQQGVEIITFPVTHGKIQVTGLKIVGGRQSIIYSADCIIDQKLHDAISEDVRILIQDCGGGENSTAAHAGLSEIIDMVKEYDGIQTVYLVHLPPIFSLTESEVNRIASERGCAARFKIPHPFDEIEVNLL